MRGFFVGATAFLAAAIMGIAILSVKTPGNGYLQADGEHLHPALMATDAALMTEVAGLRTVVATLSTPAPTHTHAPTQTPGGGVIIVTATPPATATWVTPTQEASLTPYPTTPAITIATNVSGSNLRVRSACNTSAAIIRTVAPNATVEVDTTTMTSSSATVRYGWIRTTDGNCIAHEQNVSGTYSLWLNWNER